MDFPTLVWLTILSLEALIADSNKDATTTDWEMESELESSGDRVYSNNAIHTNYDTLMQKYNDAPNPELANIGSPNPIPNLIPMNFIP